MTIAILNPTKNTSNTNWTHTWTLVQTKASMPVLCGIPTAPRKTALLDAAQNRAARWVLKSRWDPESLRWIKSSGDCVLSLNWLSLSTRRMYFVIMFLFNGLLISNIKVHLLPQSRETRSHKFNDILNNILHR